jgi:hypothetical protein
MKQGIIGLFCSPPPLPKRLEFDLGSIQTLGEIDNLPSVRLETSPFACSSESVQIFHFDPTTTIMRQK